MFFLPTKKNGSVKNCWLKGSLGNPKSFFYGNVKNLLLETFGELLGKQEGRDGLGETKPIQIPATPLGMMGSRRRMWHHKQAIIKSDSLEIWHLSLSSVSWVSAAHRILHTSAMWPKASWEDLCGLKLLQWDQTIKNEHKRLSPTECQQTFHWTQKNIFFVWLSFYLKNGLGLNHSRKHLCW